MSDLAARPKPVTGIRAKSLVRFDAGKEPEPRIPPRTAVYEVHALDPIFERRRVVERTGRSSSGSLRAADPCLFPCGGRAGAHSFVHQAFEGLVWSSVVESPLQSSFASHRRPRSFEPGRLPGFRALIATSPGRVHCENGIPTPSSVPSTGAHSLPTVYSALRLRGLLHPRAAFRALSPAQGVLSPRSTKSSSLLECPPAVSAHALARISRSRLPGRSASTPRRCSAWSSVQTGSV
jgi:hypothetical protein